MALKDLFAVIDNGLKDVFDRKAADPAKAQRPLLRGIDRALAQFKSGSAGTPTGWYKVRNGIIALTVKVGGDSFDINGVATNHMPIDRFEEFLTNMRAAVEAGEFDAELANHGNGDAEVTSLSSANRRRSRPRRPRRAASRPSPAVKPTTRRLHERNWVNHRATATSPELLATQSATCHLHVTSDLLRRGTCANQ